MKLLVTHRLAFPPTHLSQKMYVISIYTNCFRVTTRLSDCSTGTAGLCRPCRRYNHHRLVSTHGPYEHPVLLRISHQSNHPRIPRSVVSSLHDPLLSITDVSIGSYSTHPVLGGIPHLFRRRRSLRSIKPPNVQAACLLFLIHRSAP
jgi:hypothetical protein